MQRSLIFLCLFCSLMAANAQSVKDLNSAAKSGAARPPSGGGNSYRGGGDAFELFLLVRSILWMSEGLVQLGREEVRLAARNKEENHLFCLDLKPQAGYGFTGFARLQPQLRANAGWFSLDLKHCILQDEGAEFRSTGFMFWMNFWNKGKFRFRGGIGSLGMLNDWNYLQYGLAAEYIPTPKIRLELEAAQSESLSGDGSRPLREIQLRVYHPFWTKGILQASLFGGLSNQQYFRKLDFTSVDAGLNFRISASRFPVLSSKAE